MKHLLFSASGLIVAAALVTGARPMAQASEELARRQYDSGLAFVQNGRYNEALKDFQAVVDSFPKSGVADDALLQIALYHLDVAQDHAAAQIAIDRLLKDYLASDSAPMGYVVLGRLTVARSRAAAEIETALASFERVPRFFPGSAAVAAAGFYTGETLRQARRPDEALEQFRRVSLEHPRSIWAARADLAAAANLVASDRATQAFGRLQRIRQRFPGTPEAAAAINLNTIVYRLYLRKPAPYAFSGRFIGGERERFRDIIGLTVDSRGRVMLGHKQGVTIFDATGAPVRQVAVADPSAFFVDARERVVVIRKDLMVPEGGAPLAIAVPVPGRAPRQVEDMPSVIMLSDEDRLISDKKTKTVIRVAPDGRFVSNFATVNTERLARNVFEDVAMIDRDTKGIVIVDRDGKSLAKIPAKGPNYQIDDPADLAYDALGHLFVLDGRRAAVHVFGARNRLIATISAPGRESGSLQKPKALALDAAGRLYVFDESSQRIQVYQ